MRITSPDETIIDPFQDHHLRRYSFAWRHLASRTGRHLDLGCGVGGFLLPFRERIALRCIGADPHPKYLEEIRAAIDEVPLVRVGIADPLPFRSGAFESITLLDVLEHVPREARFLAEVHRILAPGGLVVVTVPARHIFSFLDPDQIKFRCPAIHRCVYSARFGRETYRARFVDRSDQLFGDMSIGRHEHTNYRRDELERLLQRAGFERMSFEGANLFWRFLQIPALLSGGRLRRIFERAALADGRVFHSANLFVAAYKPAVTHEPPSTPRSAGPGDGAR